MSTSSSAIAQVLALRHVVLACATLLLPLATFQAPAQTPPRSPDTQRILDSIQKNRASISTEDRASAQRLIAKGDQAYRQHNYADAYRAYRDAYPNAPLAYAYVFAGDAHWRAVLQHSQGQPAAAGACPLENTYFAHDLSQDLAQNQDVGLTLIGQTGSSVANRPPITRTVLDRVRKEVADLHALAEQYAKQPPSACVDLHKLRDSLGPPLLK